MVIIMMTILKPTDLNSYKTDRAGHIFNRCTVISATWIQRSLL